VATVEELRARLRKPLQRELARGCHDDVVDGGVERLLATLGAPFKDVQTQLAGYRGWDRERRRDAILASLDLLMPQEHPQAQNNGGTTKSDAAATASTEAQAPPTHTSEAVLDAELGSVPIGLAKQAPQRLAKLGLLTFRDVLYALPRRYEDRRALPSFADLEGREQATVSGTLLGRKAHHSPRGPHVLRAFMEDQGGRRLTLVWFNQPWLQEALYPGRTVVATGRIKTRGSATELSVQHHEIMEADGTLSTDRIVGLYKTPQGVAQDYLRRAVHTVLEAFSAIPDHLPKRVLDQQNLVSLDTALRDAHFPPSEEALNRALDRLRFDEFLFLELRVLRTRLASEGGRATQVRPSDLQTFQAQLPFTFTSAQTRVTQEMIEDLASPRQMARLLQGDVGSGKTAVAAAAAYLVIQTGRQVALMAPTEILARQHFANLRGYLHPLGVRSDMLLGSHTAGERRDARARVASGEANLVVGTHGAGLSNIPDVLVMSATPIPRSLALTAYGDLDLSVIDELPPGRTPVETRLVDAKRRHEVYRDIWKEIQGGQQAFVVAPLIEKSEAESMQEIVSATDMANDLKQILPDACRIELLHGRMPAAEKDDIMRRFRDHEADLLVATTVIEVGVDIPNASIMVIENAERFGLAQLHQLRGRVGRGAAVSRCILVAGDRSRETTKRLKVVVDHTDGFIISEKDLELRGPGELRGTRQSGLPDLLLGDLSRDVDVIERSRDLAKRILEADVNLDARWAARLKAELTRRVEAVGLRQVI
jgi:ATP-dependent DNA helicase RecG